MPRNGLVKANTAYETAVLIEYNDDCFALKRSTLTPDVPYGKRFIAHTQICVLNKGNGSCRMICSVEAEFPEGPPMGVGGQIKKGMNSGTKEVFTKIGETIRDHGLHTTSM